MVHLDSWTDLILGIFAIDQVISFGLYYVLYFGNCMDTDLSWYCTI